MKKLAAVLLCLALCACSTTSTVHKPNNGVPGQKYGFSFVNQGGDDAEGIATLQRTIRNHLSFAGLLAADSSHAGKIEVTLAHYYMRSNGARFWAGVMAGRDKIKSSVRVTDVNGNEVGNFDVESTNATAMGSTDGLMDKHAKEIVARLR